VYVVVFDVYVVVFDVYVVVLMLLFMSLHTLL